MVETEWPTMSHFDRRNYHFLHCGASFHVFEIRNGICCTIVFVTIFETTLSFVLTLCSYFLILSFSLYCFFHKRRGNK